MVLAYGVDVWPDRISRPMSGSAAVTGLGGCMFSRKANGPDGRPATPAAPARLTSRVRKRTPHCLCSTPPAPHTACTPQRLCFTPPALHTTPCRHTWPQLRTAVGRDAPPCDLHQKVARTHGAGARRVWVHTCHQHACTPHACVCVPPHSLKLLASGKVSVPATFGISVEVVVAYRRSQCNSNSNVVHTRECRCMCPHMWVCGITGEGAYVHTWDCRGLNRPGEGTAGGEVCTHVDWYMCHPSQPLKRLLLQSALEKAQGSLRKLIKA
eukprot:366293-Chlamydomonas_euryale.AAC.3